MNLLNDKVLLATVVALLCMCGWVWLWPASYLVGWWPAHDARLELAISQPGMPAPSDVFSKYGPHAAVKLTHILPSGLWSLCGALQLLPQLRNTAPRLHRLSGRLMFLCSALIVVGYGLIEARGLVTAELRGGGAATPSDGTASKHNPHHASLRLLSAWFALTAAVALAQARRGRLKSHARWALRHVAAGGWVVLQRLIVLAVATAASAVGVAFSEARRRELFFAASTAAVSICLPGVELYLWLLGSGGRPEGGKGGGGFATATARGKGDAARATD